MLPPGRKYDLQATAIAARSLSCVLSGRCLCGAVCWSSNGAPSAVHHCHCGICRRWTGAAFATLVWFARSNLGWMGDEPASYRSSPIALRTHCGRRGTPLALIYDARDDIALSVGSLDHPGLVWPTHHYGVEARLAWADIGRELPAKPTRERW
jgi:hypothetical protein